MRSISALLRTAEDSELQYPVAARAVKRNFYMGDFFKVLRTTDKALQLEQQLIVMPKWVSNLNKVIECITHAKRAPSIKDRILPVERALRVIRDTRSDSFVCKGVKRDLMDKRRKILSLIASLFDPISFLAPFLVRAKSSFNKCGKLVLAGINTPPPEFLSEWSKWQRVLVGLSKFLILRVLCHVGDSPTVIQLHVFGDANERAFCSIAYFRFS